LKVTVSAFLQCDGDGVVVDDDDDDDCNCRDGDDGSAAVMLMLLLAAVVVVEVSSWILASARPRNEGPLVVLTTVEAG
jgi:hypothetical protein